ncbi:MAG TPA: hypothetical protein VNN77_10230 [candidate division Zixibacteria bacterium]|nr:hypothetical protein [candidate division Zixibacteria bacterium]
MDLIVPFVSMVADGSVEIYNEFSLQHELGIFLRRALPDLKIQFERNVGYFFPGSTSFTKREIDISAFSDPGRRLSFAVELKYPRNGQYPEQMFSFCKDIAFAEELVEAGFPLAGFVVFSEDRLFYEGPKEGIYRFFRGGTPLHGRITKPTGAKNEEVTIKGHHNIVWKEVRGGLRCSVVEIRHGN